MDNNTPVLYLGTAALYLTLLSALLLEYRNLAIDQEIFVSIFLIIPAVILTMVASVGFMLWTVMKSLDESRGELKHLGYKFIDQVLSKDLGREISFSRYEDISPMLDKIIDTSISRCEKTTAVQLRALDIFISDKIAGANREVLPAIIITCLLVTISVVSLPFTNLILSNAILAVLWIGTGIICFSAMMVRFTSFLLDLFPTATIPSIIAEEINSIEGTIKD